MQIFGGGVYGKFRTLDYVKTHEIESALDHSVLNSTI